MKKFLALLLALCMIMSMVACTGNTNDDTTPTGDTTPTEGTGETTVDTNGIAPDTYTYNTYSAALGTNWNPHTWETNADSGVLSYIEAPLADITVLDSEAGSYQWIFVAATDIKDVTADHQDDLVKFGCAETEATEGYVYEIALREGMVWQDGTPINADTYIYSMKQLLDPAMQNYRANNYYSGDSAVAGGKAYYFQGQSVTLASDSIHNEYSDALDAELVFSLAAPSNEAGEVSMRTAMGFPASYDAVACAEYLIGNYLDGTAFTAEAAAAMEGKTLAEIKADEALNAAWEALIGWWQTEPNEELDFFLATQTYPACDYDSTVGCYKVDDYTIRYVCQTAYDYYYFLTSCTSNWIVHEELYESCKTVDEVSGLVTSTYGTSKDTTMSYGAYMIESLEDAKQLVYVQNPTYFEYITDDNGNLYSTTETIGFQVDGEYQPQFQAQKIVVDVMTDDAAKLAFLAGELDDWVVSAEDAITYGTSEQMYKVDETYTMRLFFATNLDSLKQMDAEGTNINGVVMSNYNFRKAFSLAIDRADWVTATAGYKPAYSLLNSLYFYDVYEDPTSIYRNTDEAKQAIVNLYGIEYGEGTPYADLDAAYASVNGYNLTEAKNLMKTACEELVADGLYTAGDPIEIKVAWSAGSIDSSGQQCVTLLEKYLNNAIEGSGFGPITLTALDNLSQRYLDVSNGVYAIGYGAWGGAAFYPFNAIGCYTDAEYAGYIHEGNCWDPAVETLTLNINGEDITMTYEAWSRTIKGTGEYANADAATKLAILAGLEENILNLYYLIPLASDVSCSMMSYKTSNYTDNYSIMYGFGGLRLTTFNYTNAEWADFVAGANGNLGY